ncbi:hypothetical protein M3231_01185 [Neobacillus mesonae]|nr:hypothetical protein [Neobacillus mesonae]
MALKVKYSITEYGMRFFCCEKRLQGFVTTMEQTCRGIRTCTNCRKGQEHVPITDLMNIYKLQKCGCSPIAEPIKRVLRKAILQNRDVLINYLHNLSFSRKYI